MGITHYSIINSHPNIEVKAVADTSAMVLNMMDKYLKGLNVYTDFNKLLSQEELDAVIICTPPKLHHPISKLAASNGIHVFCEKPFTIDQNEARELSELFTEKGLVNQVGYVNRFNDIFVAVKRMLDDGVIGDVIRFKSEMYSCTITKPEEGNTWRDSRDSGGGAVYEVASHALDLVNFLVGKPDKITGTSMTSVYSPHVEDAVNATLLYKGGKAGTLNVNWSDESYRKPTNKIEMFGTRGKILADQHGLKVFLKEPNEEEKLRKGWNQYYITDVFRPVPFYVRGNEFTNQLYHFVDCIEGKVQTNKSDFGDGLATLMVIDDLFEDFEQNGKL